MALIFKPPLRDLIRGVKPSVVAIGFKPSANQVTVLGSGFSVGQDKKILSVAHVYNQIPKEHIKNMVAGVMVTVEDNIDHYGWIPIELIAGKKNDNDDVALFRLINPESHLFQVSPNKTIRFDLSKPDILPPLDLGDSEKPEVGDDVYFIGFPYAAQLINEGFGATLIANKGIISNIKRDGVDPSHQRNFIVVDAVSNPGNSGCPLIDVESNKVIGVMSMAFRIKSKTQPNLDIREPMHIGAARPINLAKPLL